MNDTQFQICRLVKDSLNKLNLDLKTNKIVLGTKNVSLISLIWVPTSKPQNNIAD